MQKSEVVPVKNPVFERWNHTIGAQLHCDLPAGNACGGALKDTLHNRGGFRVGNQAVPVLGIFGIAIGWTGAVFAPAPLHFQNIFDLPEPVPKINLIHGELERRHHIFTFRIKVIGNRNISDLLFRKKTAPRNSWIPAYHGRAGTDPS